MREDDAKDGDIAHRHDKFFRGALAIPQVAREFVKTHYPASITSCIDMNSLKLEPDSFIEKNLKKSICDVLLSAKIDGQDGLLYLLLEHQSEPDYWMSMRLMKYMMNICSRYLEQNPKAKKLPLIYPLVLYNGKQKYQVSSNLWELFVDPEKAKEAWNKDHLVVNVHDIGDEELKQRTWSGIMEFFMKHIYDRNIIQAWQQIREVIPKLIEVKDIGFNYLELILHYSLTAVEKDDKVKLEETLKSCIEEKNEEKLMTSLAYHWREEGREEGKEEGVKKTAINMLKRKFDIKVVSEITGLSIIKVRSLKSKI